jgi:hypothetical protein
MHRRRFGGRFDSSGTGVGAQRAGRYAKLTERYFDGNRAGETEGRQHEDEQHRGVGEG